MTEFWDRFHKWKYNLAVILDDMESVVLGDNEGMPGTMFEVIEHVYNQLDEAIQELQELEEKDNDQ